MITPRVTRLVRVPDLKAMREAVAQLVPGGDLSVRRTAVIVPTRAAAEELRRSLELAAHRAGAAVRLLPELCTRAELYQQLHASMEAPAALLTGPEREVLLRRAARDVIASGVIPPFRLRPGLLLEMLDFYDELRRREQSLDDFARHATAALEVSADVDRGAERLLRQTEFLCAAYAAFERATAATGCLDEHSLRSVLLDSTQPPQRAFTRVIVTVADRAAEGRGLYGSDFDLLTRLGGIERLDVIATEDLLASGFHERIHQLLPELAEERLGSSAPLPALVIPEAAEPDQPWFVCRDREEELADVARRLKVRSASAHEAHRPPPLDRIGVVFQRPLPYLYLARQVFTDAGIPWEASDALPLSAEPFSAAVDVLFSFITSEANRRASLELLSSPHFTFRALVSDAELASFDAWLRNIKYAGGWERLAQLSDPPAACRTPLELAAQVAEAVAAVRTGASASAQVDALIGFVRRFEQLPGEDDEWGPRHLRARAAVLAVLASLRDAHHRHDDEPLDVVELSGTVRRWIDSHTFAPRTGTAGVRLLDAISARYADLDELRIVGLVESDWPEPSRRSIFYPASILANLGWPADASRTAAARAHFRDLLASPHRRVSASLFTLEDDAVVAPSPLGEEIASAGLEVERWPVLPGARVFLHESLAAGDLASGPASGEAVSEWLALRVARAARPPVERGAAGPRQSGTYAISYVERYLDCPFKYFAGRLLQLPEERDEESGLTPIERGHFIHDVFETFFGDWQAAGHGTITTVNVAEALEMFEAVAERKLEDLTEADRPLERTHLLGSAAASGLGERAFAFEIEQGGDVIERLLEHPLEGEFTFTAGDQQRTLRIKAKADRIDLMKDGTLRIIDYKLGRAPKLSKALQLSIYGVMATQWLEGRHGRSWQVANAGYVAFKERDAFVPLGGRTPLATAIAEGQARLLTAVDAIERGEFPVQPDEPFRCQWCGYAAVCRKDYVGDE